MAAIAVKNELARCVYAIPGRNPGFCPWILYIFFTPHSRNSDRTWKKMIHIKYMFHIIVPVGTYIQVDICNRNIY